MLVGSIFLARELIALELFRITKRRRWLVILAGTFLVWSNVHAGVMFGLALAALAACEALAAAVWGSKLGPFALEHGAPGALACVTAFGIVSVFLGPNGVDVLRYPMELNRFVFHSGLDLDLGLFAPATPRNTPVFYAYLCLLLAGLVGRRDERPIGWFEILSVAGFTVLAIRMHRFILDETVVAAPIVTKLWVDRFSRARWRDAVAAILLVTAAAIASRGVERRLLAPFFPQSAAAFLESERLSGRLFHPQNFGGYLGWRLRRPIFWDGRDVEFASLSEEMARDGFAAVMDRYQVDVLLLTETEYVPIVGALTPDRWALVYYDDDDAIYVRRAAVATDWIDHHELKVFPPFGSTPGLRSIAESPERLAAARAELDRVLALHAGTKRAMFRQALLSFYARDLARAQRELASILDAEYDASVANALRAVIEARIRAGSAGDT
jgi:hypothetical protein